MNIRSIAVASLAALTLVVGLTGCTGANNDRDFEVPHEVTQEATSTENFTVKFDQTTGHIVKVSNEATSEVLYADPALSTIDEASLLIVNDRLNPFTVNTAEAPHSFTVLSSPDELRFSNSVEVMVQIDNKPYPTRTSIAGLVSFNSYKDVVQYYNTNVADPSLITNTPPVDGVIGWHVFKQLRASAQKAAELSIDYTTNILEIRGDDIVAADKANGVPAWKAYQNSPSRGQDPYYNEPTPPGGMSDNPQNSQPAAIYAYSYMCATYEAFPTNASYDLEEINSLLNDAVTVTEIISSNEPILAETTAPCEVIKIMR